MINIPFDIIKEYIIIEKEELKDFFKVLIDVIILYMELIINYL